MLFQLSTPTVPVFNSTETFPVRRIYCVGRNYAAHAREMGHDPNKEPPFFFSKPADVILPVAANTVGVFPYPQQSKNCHVETELVVALHKGGSNISAAQALDCVFGYAVGFDMTLRDIQGDLKKLGRPWEVSKAFEYSAPIGPIVRAAELPNIQQAAIHLDINQKAAQSATIADLIWSIPDIIAYLSQWFTLAPGDLIFTGTPEGVTAIQANDTLKATVEGIPPLELRVKGS